MSASRRTAAILILLFLVFQVRSPASELAADLGGSPVPVGAGPRALGMGGAFTAVADDATANTWNPGGMIQLERPEAAFSMAYRVDRTRSPDRGDSNTSTANLDHVSLVLPFFVGGAQQTVGLAWQRQLDFTRSIAFEQHEVTSGSNSSLMVDGSQRAEQEGGFASVSASYAIEPLPGLGLGVTAHGWNDDWTMNSHYKRRDQSDTITSLAITFPPITLIQRDEIDNHRTTTVEKGYSFTLGAWWQATPSLTVAATVKPEYHLHLLSEVESHQRSTDVSSSTVIADSTTRFVYPSEFIYPTSATVAAAWRAYDVHTIAVDVGWTRWRDYRIRQGGVTSSPVNILIDPKRFPDTYTVRLGYEHLSILPRAVLVERLGAFYEGLPAATRIADSSQVGQAEPTVDDFYGATAGLSLCLRSVLYDLSAQVRTGNDVGAGQYGPLTQSVDILTVTARAGVTCQF
ncbi:MAG: outer membrane protein transport protein [Planctomycetes bacterium]|nr:outer membrane protein transport protein [Planctomycetota bacterium]